MTHFRYRALAAGGDACRGIMIAADTDQLAQRLKQAGLDLVSCRPATVLRQRRLPRRQVINICFHLDQFVRAGIPLVDGLRDLRDSLDEPESRDHMASVVAAVEGGSTLSAAMAGLDGAFDTIVVGLIHAGEESGRLADVLGKLIESLKWQDELGAQSRRLLAYPAFVAVTVAIALIFLVSTVLPQMLPFLLALGRELPLQTRLLVWLANGWREYWPTLCAALAASTLAGLLWWRLSPTAAERLDRALLHLPLIGELRRKIILARFADVLATMYAAGIPLLDALRSLGGVIGNRDIERAVCTAANGISAGQSLSAAFADTGVLPPLVVRMLRIGEQTGALDTALANVSYFFGREARERIAGLQASIEPTLTILVGLLLAWVMLAVLGPVYDAVGSLRL